MDPQIAQLPHGVDGISMPMVFLTLSHWFYRLLLDHQRAGELAFRALPVAQTACVGVFVALDSFLFIFWEISLVPLYFIIGAWAA